MRSYAVAVLLSLSSAAGAAGCFWKAHQIRADAEWVMARATAQADEYVSSFDGTLVDQELATLASRRELLQGAQSWENGEQLLVMASVLLLFAAYGLRVFARVQKVGADGQILEESLEPVPAQLRVAEARVRAN